MAGAIVGGTGALQLCRQNPRIHQRTKFYLNMKKLLLAKLILIGFHFTAGAQQKPQYTQYVFNNFLLNPAVSGIENYIDVKAGYRSQWTGLQGAPVTNYVTINAPLGSDFIEGDATAFPEDGDDPMSRSYRQYYQAAKPHHG